MKTTEFRQQMTSSKLRENLNKQFGVNVNLEKYNREKLEDMRNKLRTRIFQHEGASKFNDLLKNEAYQKDKAMLELLNTRIKEMLGEDIKKLKDKMVELSEGKKGVKIAKHPQGSKKATKDYDGDGKVETPKDEVWGSRAKAAAKSGKAFKEGFPTVDDAKKASAGTSGMKTGDSKKSSTGGTITKTATGLKHTAGKNYGGEDAPKTPDSDKKSKKVKEGAPSCGHTKETKGCKECSGMWEGKNAKPDFLDADKDGDKKETMKKAVKDKKTNVKESQAIFKRHVRIVNESLAALLAEDEEGKAKAITAAGDMVNDYTSWMQRVGQYQTKSMIELADAIRADFGAQEAEAFKAAVGPALSSTLEVLTQQREAISNAVAVLAGEAAPEAPMGAEPAGMPMEPGMEPAGPDMMNPGGDEFAASDAAAGGPEAAGRAMRESKEQRRARKLAEAHSILSKLAK